jgi:hypothetical protein
MTALTRGELVEGLQIDRKSEHLLDEQAGHFPQPAMIVVSIPQSRPASVRPGRILSDRQLHRVTDASHDAAVLAIIPPVNGVLLSSLQRPGGSLHRNGAVTGRTTVARATSAAVSPDRPGVSVWSAGLPRAGPAHHTGAGHCD